MRCSGAARASEPAVARRVPAPRAARCRGPNGRSSGRSRSPACSRRACPRARAGQAGAGASRWADAVTAARPLPGARPGRPLATWRPSSIPPVPPGPAKGVLVTWGQIANAVGLRPRQLLGPEDAYFTPWPPFHVMGLTPLAIMADAGGRVDAARRPIDLAVLERHRRTWLHLRHDRPDRAATDGPAGRPDDSRPRPPIGGHGPGHAGRRRVPGAVRARGDGRVRQQRDRLPARQPAVHQANRHLVGSSGPATPPGSSTSACETCRTGRSGRASGTAARAVPGKSRLPGPAGADCASLGRGLLPDGRCVHPPSGRHLRVR